MSGGKGGADPLPSTLWQKSSKQEPLVPPKKQRQNQFGFLSNYEPSYDDVAFKLLSESDEAKTDCHLCGALRCTPDTLRSWRQKYQSFNEAVIIGKKIGEQKWRNRIAQHAFEPTARVNNGLIKLLSSNVYGMKEEPTTQVTVVQQNVDPEVYLKERGIPLPGVDLGGVDDVTDQADLPEELE